MSKLILGIGIIHTGHLSAIKVMQCGSAITGTLTMLFVVHTWEFLEISELNANVV